MGVYPEEKYMPTKEDIESVRRIFAAKKYGIRAVWAAGYAPEEDEGWDDNPPECQFWISFDATKGSKWTIGMDISKRLSKSALADKYWIYVLTYPDSVIETNFTEASKIPEGVTQVWPLDVYGKSTFTLGDKRRDRYTQRKNQFAM